jgi:hypothetical protein
MLTGHVSYGPKLPTCALQQSRQVSGVHRTCRKRPLLSQHDWLIEANDVKRVLADINAHRGNGRN